MKASAFGLLIARGYAGLVLLFCSILFEISGSIDDYGRLVRSVAIGTILALLSDRARFSALLARSGQEGVAAGEEMFAYDLVGQALRSLVLILPAGILVGWIVDVGPLVSSPLVVSAVLARNFGELMRAHRRFASYALVSSVGPWTGVLIAGLAGFGLNGLTAETVVLGHLLGVSFAVSSTAVKGFPFRLLLKSKFDHSYSDSWFFVDGLLGLLVQNIDVLATGVILGPVAAGYYAVASRLAAALLLPLGAVNARNSSLFSELWAKGKTEELCLAARESARFSFALVLVGQTLVAGAAVANEILGLAVPSIIFWTSLPLLAGAAVASLTGSCGLLLAVVGRQKQSARISFFALVFSSVLVVPLSVGFGAVGAAFAFGLGTVIQNVAQWRALLSATGVNSAAKSPRASALVA